MFTHGEIEIHILPVKLMIVVLQEGAKLRTVYLLKRFLHANEGTRDICSALKIIVKNVENFVNSLRLHMFTSRSYLLPTGALKLQDWTMKDWTMKDYTMTDGLFLLRLN